MVSIMSLSRRVVFNLLYSDLVALTALDMIRRGGYAQPPYSRRDWRGSYPQPQPAGPIQLQPAQLAQPQLADFAHPSHCAQPPYYYGQDWQEAYGQPQLPDFARLPRSSKRWPGVQPQPQYAGFSGRDALFTNTAALEVPVAAPVPSNGKNLWHFTHLRNIHQKLTVPFGGWGDYQGGYATGALRPVSLQA